MPCKQELGISFRTCLPTTQTYHSLLDHTLFPIQTIIFQHCYPRYSGGCSSDDLCLRVRITFTLKRCFERDEPLVGANGNTYCDGLIQSTAFLPTYRYNHKFTGNRDWKMALTYNMRSTDLGVQHRHSHYQIISRERWEKSWEIHLDNCALNCSDCCSSRGPGFYSQYLHGSSQPAVRPVPGDPMPSSGLLVVHKHTSRQKHPGTHKEGKEFKNMPSGIHVEIYFYLK